MFSSRFMPCQECGESVDQTGFGSAHQCSPERRAAYLAFEMRHEIAQLEAAVSSYLTTATGRFEAWLAARQVRGEA